MNTEISKITEAFKTQTEDRRKPAKKLLPVITTGMSSSKVEDLLGIPDYIHWEYSLFYSSILTLQFDDQGKVINLSSDIAGAEGVKPYLRPEDPKMVAAINEFKSQPYNRQKAAEQLIPLIKKDMPNTYINKILGSPTQIIWDYHLYDTLTASLIVRFDSDEKVLKASLVGLEGNK